MMTSHGKWSIAEPFQLTPLRLCILNVFWTLPPFLCSIRPAIAMLGSGGMVREMGKELSTMPGGDLERQWSCPVIKNHSFVCVCVY